MYIPLKVIFINLCKDNFLLLYLLNLLDKNTQLYANSIYCTGRFQYPASST